LECHENFAEKLGDKLNSRLSSALLAGLIALGLLVLASLTYANYRYTTQNPGGNDFLSRWVGTRLFLTRGLSPYSEQTARQIHEMAYGRAALPGEDQMLFAYPFYTTIVIAPFALIGDYAMARAVWMTALETAIIIVAILAISLSSWRLPAWLLAILMIFALLWYYGLRPVINGNPAVFVALFVSLALLAIRSGLDPIAGFLLAMATIKPQMVVLLIPLVLAWSISHRRWSLVASFLGSLTLLIASFSLFFPDWIVQNLRQILSYPEYTLASTPGGILVEWLPGVGRQLGWGTTIVFSLVLAWEWRSVIRQDYHWFFWTACLTLVITNVIGIQTATENYVAMFPGLVLVFAVWDERWRAGRWLVLSSILLLFVGLWFLFINTLQSGGQPIQHPIMFFPLPILLFVGLYWIRWWAIRPPRLFLEKFREAQGREQVELHS